ALGRSRLLGRGGLFGGGRLLRRGLGFGGADDRGHGLRLLLLGGRRRLALDGRGGLALCWTSRLLLRRSRIRGGHHHGHALFAEVPQERGGVRHGDVRLLEGLTDILRLEETLRAPTLEQSLNDGLVQLLWLRASRTCRRHEHLSNERVATMDPVPARGLLPLSEIGEAVRTATDLPAFWHDLALHTATSRRLTSTLGRPRE